MERSVFEGERIINVAIAGRGYACSLERVGNDGACAAARARERQGSRGAAAV